MKTLPARFLGLVSVFALLAFGAAACEDDDNPLGDGDGDVAHPVMPQATDVTGACDEIGTALAREPWLDRIPATVVAALTVALLPARGLAVDHDVLVLAAVGQLRDPVDIGTVRHRGGRLRLGEHPLVFEDAVPRKRHPAQDGSLRLGVDAFGEHHRDRPRADLEPIGGDAMLLGPVGALRQDADEELTRPRERFLRLGLQDLPLVGDDASPRIERGADRDAALRRLELRERELADHVVAAPDVEQAQSDRDHVGRDVTHDAHNATARSTSRGTVERADLDRSATAIGPMRAGTGRDASLEDALHGTVAMLAA